MADHIWQIKTSKRKRYTWERSQKFSIHLAKFHNILITLSDYFCFFLIAVECRLVISSEMFVKQFFSAASQAATKNF